MREVLQLFVSSEAPTHLNSDRFEKLRKSEWLISTILLEINQLKRRTVKRYPVQSPETYGQLKCPTPP
jgi:hypothetical protein